jgi:hypothetical protein
MIADFRPVFASIIPHFHKFDHKTSEIAISYSYQIL